MSPRPAAPSRASVTACSTTSASEWPSSPLGWSRRTPPRMRGRPSTSRWVSCPLPTRTLASPARPGAPGRLGSLYLLDAEAAVDGVVLVAHALLERGEGDLAGGAVALLGDGEIDDVVLGAGVE